ncbi:hypothetical protein QE152_g5270 [Popillia japonica]|uniref:Endonuclease/exonuclease/phosphatase domain-containing protein n=1 Tax=Popillia japonica TaxID=7064 RepID=A0AAW1MLH2_POPJA
MDYIRFFVEENGIDILTVCETWLNASITADLINIKNYTLIRKDRTLRAGGGVGIYVRNTFQFLPISTLDAIEQLWISVQIGKQKFGVGTVYNPLQANYREFLDVLENSFIQCHLTTDEVFCLGDFNIDLLKREHPSAIFLNAFLSSIGIKQLIDCPTRLTDSSRSLLDLILVTDDNIIVDSGVVNCHVSDHDFVFCSVTNNDLQSRPTLRTFRSFKNISFVDFQSDLRSIHFDRMLRLNTIEDKVHFFNTSILDLFNQYAPLIFRTFTKKPIPWLTDNLKLMMRMRDEAKSLFRRSRRLGDWEYYKSLRNLTNRTFKLEKRAYFDYISHTGDSRLLWKQLNVLGVKRQNEINIPQTLKDPNMINSFFTNSVSNINRRTFCFRLIIPYPKNSAPL